jgi:hypothetical protein
VRSSSATWLLTGLEDDAAGVFGSDSALSEATPSGSTLNRPEGGAAASPLGRPLDLGHTSETFLPREQALRADGSSTADYTTERLGTKPAAILVNLDGLLTTT